MQVYLLIINPTTDNKILLVKIPYIYIFVFIALLSWHSSFSSEATLGV